MDCVCYARRLASAQRLAVVIGLFGGVVGGVFWDGAERIASAAPSGAEAPRKAGGKGARSARKPAPAEPPAKKPAPAEPPGEQSTHFDAKARAGKKDLVGVMKDSGNFETLLKAVDAAGLDQLLRGHGPLTLFAPSDEAFAKLPSGLLDRWLKEPQQLRQILRGHVLRAYVPAKQVARLRNALTASGALVRIDAGSPSAIKVNDATVVKSDILAGNGVIHAVDGVLLPQEKSTKKDAGKKPAAPKKTDEEAEEKSGGEG
jgi:uncharacterized surface protein with fasciclin (FAS1) repeats